MAELKNKPNDGSVAAYIASIEKLTASRGLRATASRDGKVTKAKPQMWGPTIVGFGSYHYVYESGREGDWFVAGFSSRKQALTLYVMGCLDEIGEDTQKLGKFKHGKSCIYIKTLDDIDLKVLKQLIRKAQAKLKKLYG